MQKYVKEKCEDEGENRICFIAENRIKKIVNRFNKKFNQIIKVALSFFGRLLFVVNCDEDCEKENDSGGDH